MRRNKIDIYQEDTIAAVATSPGVGGIGVIKVSGPDAINIISDIFTSATEKDLKKAKNYTLHYGWLKDVNSKRSKHNKKDIIDEVIVGIMRGPHSYTREDVIEIYSHSGQVVLDRVLQAVLKRGAHLAAPGEFTKRAFISGRIDLVQAESILDIVNARTDKALNLSMLQLKGELSSRIKEIDEKIEHLLVALEADVSFPEEQTGVSQKKIKEEIKGISTNIEELLENSEKNKFLREGVKSVICGRSNVGKSSLLNMLLKEERVIVTPLAGTTRDVVEENINIRGLPISISDTAGIINPRDLIEERALEKSYKNIERADLVILVFDGSEELREQDRFLIEKVKNKNTVFVINKTDLKEKIEKDVLRREKRPVVEISVLNNKGLEKLEKTIIKNVWRDFDSEQREQMFVSNIRHINLLKEAKQRLSGLVSQDNLTSDYLLFGLEEAKSKISQITGKEFSEDILNSIFDNFCIGK